MLTLVRSASDYEHAALILMDGDEVLGEILILQVSGQSVRLGLKLPREISIVRANAEVRPDGPTDEWIAAQAAFYASRPRPFNAGMYPPPPAAPAVISADAYADGAYAADGYADDDDGDDGGCYVFDVPADDLATSAQQPHLEPTYHRAAPTHYSARPASPLYTAPRGVGSVHTQRGR